MTQSAQSLSIESCSDAGISEHDLWLRYFELGGMCTFGEVGVVLRALTASISDHEHDLLAHALNERFTELKRNHPVAYRSAS